jgi:excisionase family DNA binding protein
MITQTPIQIGAAPTIPEVAKLLNLDRTTVYRYLYAGRLDVIKGFGRARVCPKSLDKFLNQTGKHTPKRRKGVVK